MLNICFLVAARVVSFDAKIITAWKSEIKLECHAVGLPEPEKKWIWKYEISEIFIRGSKFTNPELV